MGVDEKSCQWDGIEQVEREGGMRVINQSINRGFSSLKTTLPYLMIPNDSPKNIVPHNPSFLFSSFIFF